MSRAKIIANFFLDGAKIIFGSLVVGAFLPGTVNPQPQFLAVSVGIVGTIIFLTIADVVSRRERNISLESL